MIKKIPLNHYRHFKRLCLLRRSSEDEVLDYMMKKIEPLNNNWIDERWPDVEGSRNLNIKNYRINDVINSIQGIPRNLRPVTDGYYLSNFKFIHKHQGLIGIDSENIKILDFEKVTQRERDVFPLVRDLLPKMSIEEYRVYNTFNSQFLRLVREPKAFTMPTLNETSIDAGCYVGYKALAISMFTNNKDILAIELDDENFDVLKKNIKLNNKQIIPVKAALSKTSGEIHEMYTRNSKTMAHSLSDFSELKEANQLLAKQNSASIKKITTITLDELAKNYKKFSVVHISVNGHEPEVVEGGINVLKNTDRIRISVPYIRNNIPVREIVLNELKRNRIYYIGKSGGAIEAGKKRLRDNTIFKKLIDLQKKMINKFNK